MKRQQEQDLAVLLPTISHLTERQHQLFFLIHSLIARHRPDGLSRLLDEDVAQAAASVAATLETASRGVLYEHTPASLPAQKLGREITAMLAEMRAQGTRIYDGEAAIALRAIERGARDVGKSGPGDAYIALMGRLLRVTDRGRSQEQAEPNPSIIVP